MNVYDFLIQTVQGQNTPVATQWFDTLITNLKNQINNSQFNTTDKTAALSAVDIIVQNKDTLVELGQYSFTLFMYQISLGKNIEATETYIKSLTDPDTLISLMNSSADGVIKVKQELDTLHETAINLIENVLLMTAKVLIPFLIAML